MPWENGVQATLGLGFGHWEWEKNVKNEKWEWDLRIAKWDLEQKNELGNGLVPPLPLRTLSVLFVVFKMILL